MADPRAVGASPLAEGESLGYSAELAVTGSYVVWDNLVMHDDGRLAGLDPGGDVVLHTADQELFCD